MPHILLMGQTPPPWHGQAVATQILFDHDWPGFEVHRLRMEFSSEMVEVGRFQWRKVGYLFELISKARKILKAHPGCVLFYPPASAKWVPFIRDMIFLTATRYLAGSTVFIYHASGLPVFSKAGIFRSILSRIAYHNADVSLEVAQEKVTPHDVFAAKSWQWCPCGIEVPQRPQPERDAINPFTVTFVGSLQEGKGVLEVLKTAKILKDQGHGGRFNFRIVGKWFSDEFEAHTRKLHGEWQLEELVELVGQLTGEAKWDAYYNSDVFFFPTHYASEATPIVIMEALGAGLHILSTEWAGIPNMLDGCQSATLHPVRSPELYAASLIKLVDDSERAMRDFNHSQNFYQEKFLPMRFIERVNGAFLKVSNTKAFQELGKAAHDASPAADALERRPCPEKHDKSVVPPQSEAPHHPQSTIQDLPSLASSSPNNQSPIINNSSHALAVNTSSSSSSTSMFDVGCSMFDVHPPPSSSSQHFSVSDFQHLPPPSPISLSIYLADQNPGHDRSYGISRMTQVVLEALQATGRVEIGTISSQTSQQAPDGVGNAKILPWGTRRKWVRLMTDHLHPLFVGGGHGGQKADVHYFPKGYLPYFSGTRTPSVVTIHDTIIQHDQDCYPNWRKRWEYRYWARILKHTLHNADRIITVSQTSKRQIEAFMERHGIPAQEITVTYEPCLYESIPQPVGGTKENFVIHLASCEPHKRTAHLIRWWLAAEARGQQLPTLHLIGSVPMEVMPLLASAKSIVKRPFLDEAALQDAYLKASALILPSEVEGFGLPALEAYYLGTPVCYVKGTSVEEILSVATHKGGFNLQEPQSLFAALDEVMSMSAEELRSCGLKLRETYAAQKVANRMLEVFDSVARSGSDRRRKN
jgi:glycosyltransferase involved in cell wall biosynthesis